MKKKQVKSSALFLPLSHPLFLSKTTNSVLERLLLLWLSEHWHSVQLYTLQYLEFVLCLISTAKLDFQKSQKELNAQIQGLSIGVWLVIDFSVEIYTITSSDIM